MTGKRSGWLWVGSIGAVLVGVAVGFACVDAERLVAPPIARVPQHAVAPAAADQDVQTDVLGPPDPPWNVTTTPQRALSITIPPGRVARVTASGTLTFDVNPGFKVCNGNDPQTLPGGNTIGPGGLPVPPFAFRLFVGQSDATHPAVQQILQFAGTGPGPAVGYTQGFVGQGVLWAGRPAPFGFLCAGGPQNFPPSPEFFVSGSQTIMAEILPPPVITADKTSVSAGDTVTFTLEAPEGETIQFTEDLSWTWVPDPPVSSGTETVSGCGIGATCRERVQERGHVRADGIHYHNFNVSAVGPTIEVVHRELRVTLEASPRDIVPALNPRCRSSAGKSSLLIKVFRTDGSPAPGLAVALHTRFVGESGGHAHQHVDRDGFGHFGQASGETEASGMFTTDYRADSIGAVERVTAVVSHEGTTDSASVEVSTRVPGLQAFLSHGNVEVGGSLPDHPSNAFGTSLAIGRATVLADTFYALAGVKIPYNDMSLAFGGIFDLNDQFAATATPGHLGHRCGVEVDIVDKVGTRIPSLEKYLDVLIASPLVKGKLLRHNPGAHVSYHLELR